MTVTAFFFHQKLDALVHPVGDRAAARDHAAKIGLGARHFDAIISGVVDVFKDVRAFQKGFCRDAAPVEADAAEAFALDDGHFEFQLAGADGGDISAGAGADDD